MMTMNAFSGGAPILFNGHHFLLTGKSAV